MIRYWDKEYINDCLSRITNPKHLKHQMLIRFLWLSGVRITECVTLRKQDIDFNNYIMQVRWLKSRKYNHRNVPMHPKLKDIMHIYTSPMKAEDRVFPITRQRGWQIVQQHLKGNPHRLRHSFAVNWLRQGGDIITLHRILGHSKIQTTMEYLKIVPVDQAKELFKINFD